MERRDPNNESSSEFTVQSSETKNTELKRPRQRVGGACSELTEHSEV